MPPLAPGDAILDRLSAVGLPLLLALAPLPFGGRTPLASAVLCAWAAFVCASTLLSRRSAPRSEALAAIPASGALCLLLCLVFLHVLPLPRTILSAISPASAVLRDRVGLGEPWGTAPISVAPAATLAAAGRLSAAVAVFAAASMVSRRKGGARRVAFGLCAAGIIQAAYGVPAFLAGHSQLSGDAAQEWEGRLTGTFVNPNHLAALMELAIPAAIGLVLSLGSGTASPQGRRRGIRNRLALALSDPQLGRKRLLSLSVGLMSVAALFSLSRAGIALTGMACLLALSLGARSSRRRAGEPRPKLSWIAWSAGIALLALAPVAYDQAMRLAGDYRGAPTDLLAAGGRLEVWERTWGIFLDHPALGSGLGTFASTFPRYRSASVTLRWEEAHNDYLQLLAETGLAGCLILLGVIAGALAAARRSFARKHADADRPLRIALGCGCLAVLMHEFVDFGLQIPANALGFAAAAGACLVRPVPEAPHTLDPAPRRRGAAWRGGILTALAIAGAAWGALHPADASRRALERARDSMARADRAAAGWETPAVDARGVAPSGLQGARALSGEALRQLGQVVRGDPANAEAHLLLARLCRLAGPLGLPAGGVLAPDGADQRLRLAGELDPYRPDTSLGILRERLAMGDVEEAARQLAALAARRGEPLRRGLIAFWGAFPQPELIDRALGTDAGARLEFADFLISVRALGEAETRLRQLLKEGGLERGDVYDRLGWLLVRLGAAGGSVRLGEEILAGGGLDPRQRARIGMQLGRALVASGRPDEAVVRAEEALAVLGDEPGAVELAAGFYLEAGRAAEAAARYEYLLYGGGTARELPVEREKSLRSGLARAYEKARRRDAALREWKEVARLDPADAGARERISALSPAP